MSSSSKTALTPKKKKKKKYFQRELKPVFIVKWKYISGPVGHGFATSGETRMEAVTADEAKTNWLTTHNIAQRKFKVLSVTEESYNESNQQPDQNEKQTRTVGTSKEHGDWDGVPDF